MRKLVAALILVPISVLLVALAVVNRKPVMLGLNPFDANAGFGIEAPLFLFLLGAFSLGLVIGGFATWLGQGNGGKRGVLEPAGPPPWGARADGWGKRREAPAPHPRRARLAAD